MSFLKFLKKKEVIFDVKPSREVDGAEVWIVTWDKRSGEYSSDTKRAAKAFLSLDDANDFADSLKSAQKLLQNTNDIRIRIEKQS
jgi:hypothetical protein